MIKASGVEIQPYPFRHNDQPDPPRRGIVPVFRALPRLRRRRVRNGIIPLTLDLLRNRCSLRHRKERHWYCWRRAK